MSNVDDGGPAFPTDLLRGFDPCTGMTLRDWFAGQALMVVPKMLDVVDMPSGMAGKEDKFIATIAYTLADAMLAAREEE